ncbi:MAG: DNA polymerase III subunit beta [Acholeplasmatales bacterium]|nr:DNA polymerase III subunit beta [Acholeplasmatales bacterium]
MKLTIDRDVFLENLNIVSRGLPSKTSMPSLYGIKMDVTSQNMFLTTSNMDISIEVMIEDKSLNIEEPGKCLINGKFFIDIIRKVNSKKVILQLLDDNQLYIKVDRGEYKLRVMNYEDYPSIDFVTLENPLSLETSLIKSIIRETGFATAKSEKRPIFTGVNFKLVNNELTCVGTDSYRLAQKKINLNDSYNDFNIVIPSKSLDELLKIIDNNDETINVYFESNKVLFKYNNVMFQTRLIDGQFPDTQRVIPTSYLATLKFNKDDLVQAIERVSIVSPHDTEKNRELTYSTVKLNISKNQNIEISTSNSQVGDAKEEVIANEIDAAEEFQIGFNSEYMLDALRSFTDYEIIIELSGNVKPFVVKGTNTTNLLQIILPVNL